MNEKCILISFQEYRVSHQNSNLACIKTCEFVIVRLFALIHCNEFGLHLRKMGKFVLTYFVFQSSNYYVRRKMSRKRVISLPSIVFCGNEGLIMLMIVSAKFSGLQRHQNNVKDVALVPFLLILKIFHTLYLSIDDLDQVNAGWNECKNTWKFLYP